MSQSDRPWGGFYRDTGVDCPHCQRTTLTAHGDRIQSCAECGHLFQEGRDLMRDVRKSAKRRVSGDGF